jgi:hypothetical protein
MDRNNEATITDEEYVLNVATVEPGRMRMMGSVVQVVQFPVR